MFKDFYQDKIVLVTGHTGFKGAWLTQWLLQLGAKVIGVSDDVPTTPSLFDVLALSRQIEEYRLDIRDGDALLACAHKVNPDMVFHLAAQPIVKSSYEAPKSTFDVNVSGTVNVLEMIKKVDSIKASIMITSDKCYDNVEWEYGYRENDRLGGKDPYSASKACAEIVIKAYYESFFKGSQKRIASVRAGNVIGGGDWATHRIVPDCMMAWSQNEKVVLRAPQSTRPWQHVLEPLSGYLWLGALLSDSEVEHLNGASFNFGPDASVNYPVSSLIKALASHWKGVGYTMDQSEAVLTEAGLLKLCCDKAQHYLNWQASLSFDQTVQLTSEWYYVYYKGDDMIDLTKKQLLQYVTFAKEKGLQWSLNKTTQSAVFI